MKANIIKQGDTVCVEIQEYFHAHEGECECFAEDGCGAVFCEGDYIDDAGKVVQGGIPLHVYEDEDDEAPAVYETPRSLPPYPISGRVWLIEEDVHAASYGVHVIRER